VTRHDGSGTISGMRLGIAHHLGRAVAVTASSAHEVVDRRRIELIEPGMPSAPVPTSPENIAEPRQVPHESSTDSVIHRMALAATVVIT
jgi:hypothetical protein